MKVLWHFRHWYLHYRHRWVVLSRLLVVTYCQYRAQGHYHHRH
jgi:hypothetical protein